MDRIILEIEDLLAKKWRYVSSERKRKITEEVKGILRSALEGSDDDFWEFMDKAGKQAEANGLTEEKLNEILNEG